MLPVFRLMLPVVAVSARVAAALLTAPTRLMVPPELSRWMPGRLSPAVVTRPLRLRMPLESTTRLPVLDQVGSPAATPLPPGLMVTVPPLDADPPPAQTVPELVKVPLEIGRASCREGAGGGR